MFPASPPFEPQSTQRSQRIIPHRFPPLDSPTCRSQLRPTCPTSQTSQTRPTRLLNDRHCERRPKVEATQSRLYVRSRSGLSDLSDAHPPTRVSPPFFTMESMKAPPPRPLDFSNYRLLITVLSGSVSGSPSSPTQYSSTPILQHSVSCSPSLHYSVLLSSVFW